VTKSTVQGRRVALVTGSGRNIGRAIALGLAADGIDIVVNVRESRDEAESVAEAARALGVRASVAVADVRDEGAVGRMFDAALSELGPVSILVNNAAIRTEVPIEELELQEWHRVVGVVLDGAFLCCRAAVPQLRSAGNGRIVNIIGMSGQAGGSDRAHVVAAKSGLIGLTKALAVELGPSGITVNTSAPGRIDTERLRSLGTPPTDDIPLRRLGDPKEIAAVVCFLASDRASYVSGAVIPVDGGLTRTLL